MCLDNRHEWIPGVVASLGALLQAISGRVLYATPGVSPQIDSTILESVSFILEGQTKQTNACILFV